ncbi:RNA-binding ATPase activator esf2 [Hypocenomyce scalaris]|nr:RNA-binding ATPase activator esf2 [Hypocenomyce scalaris]
MTTRKRNEFLEADLSDEDLGIDYDSDAAEEAKGSRVAPKRRKLQASEDEVDVALSDADENGIDSDNHGPKASKQPDNPPEAPQSSVKKLKPLTPAQLAASQRAARKTGVLYLSRIPPFMRPQTVKHLLSPYGTITKLFLTPEPPSSHSKRISTGGNKKRSFIDGWVEFRSKKDAKICAETVNGQIVGGKKGGWYHDDIWNVKYLRGFKWGDLMAQVREEERSREERLRVEVQRAGRERKEFLGNLERAKVEGTRRRKKAAREGQSGEGGPEKGGGEVEAVEEEEEEEEEKGRARFERRFRQNEVRVKTAKGRGHEEQPEEVKRVLSKIF